MSGPPVASADKWATIKGAESIEGWLTSFEGELLYDLARKDAAEGVILEIGSWKGKSTVLLAAGSKAGKGGSVYAVDHHKGSAEHLKSLGDVHTETEFRRNLERAGISKVVVPLVMSSRDAALAWNRRPLPIRLLWIDGAHDYHSVLNDIDLWSRFLIAQGIIAFHDFTHSQGVRRAVRQRIFCSNSFAEMKIHGSILYARKRLKATPAQVLRNALAYVRLAWIEPRVRKLVGYH